MIDLRLGFSFTVACRLSMQSGCLTKPLSQSILRYVFFLARIFESSLQRGCTCMGTISLHALASACRYTKASL